MPFLYYLTQILKLLFGLGVKHGVKYGKKAALKRLEKSNLLQRYLDWTAQLYQKKTKVTGKNRRSRIDKTRKN